MTAIFIEYGIEKTDMKTFHCSNFCEKLCKASKREDFIFRIKAKDFIYKFYSLLY